jgi:AcrR family transcriptional regulator
MTASTRKAVPARRPHAAATRERILAAAAELIAERGYAATSIEALCRRAGVVRTAIYWHFGSKEGLLVPVVERVASAWIEEIQKAVYREGDALARLDRLVASLRALVVGRPELLRLLLAVALERGARDADTRRVLRGIFERAHDAIVQGVEDSIGAARSEAELVARIALAFLDAAVARSLVDPRSAEIDRIFADMRATVVAVVAARLEAWSRSVRPSGGEPR